MEMCVNGASMGMDQDPAENLKTHSLPGKIWTKLAVEAVGILVMPCCKTAKRMNYGENYQSSDIGFRLAIGYEFPDMNQK
jgi:hypothetical protein